MKANNRLRLRRSAVAALAAAMAVPLGVAASLPAQAATKTFADAKGDMDSGNDLLRVKVRNEDRIRLVAKHDNLTRQSGGGIAWFIDVNSDRRGPEFRIAGGLTAAGTDWNILRVRRWHVVGDQISCFSNLDLAPRADTSSFVLGRACVGGHQGRIRVSVEASDSDQSGDVFRDFVPARHAFTGWAKRG